MHKINDPLYTLTESLAIRVSLLLIALACLSSSTLAQPPGTLDTTFGASGVALRDISTADDQVLALAVQPDGKIIAAGYSQKPFIFTITRFNANGSADTTFGTSGVQKTLFSGPSTIYAVAIQSDGKIVVAGDVTPGSGFALARYTTTGQLDPAFGNQGQIEITNQGLSTASSIALQSDGKIVVVGNTQAGDFAVVRFTSTGGFDGTFGGGDGIVTTDFFNDTDRATSVSLQSDGTIVAAGVATDLDTLQRFALARYLADGSLDTTFGSNADGKVTTLIECGSGALGCGIDAMGIQPDGKIVVIASNEDVHLARYNSDGSLSGPMVTTDIGGITDDVDSLTIDNSGGVLITGSTNTGGNFDFFVAKYQVNGGLDTAFDNGDGIVITPLGSNSDLAHSVAFQGSKIIVGGSKGDFGSKQFALVRYLGLQPTAASVSVAGRVTNASGFGIKGVSVSLANGQGTTLYALTSSFGYYSFQNVQVGHTYFLTANSTRYTFTPNTLVINLLDEYTDANFIASN